MASANKRSMHQVQTKKPLFSFGVISDVQHAEIPDGLSFRGIPRYYQHSINVLQRAIASWNGHRELKFSLNFGDIVDGLCPKSKSLQTVEKIVEEFQKFDGPVYHMIGNHCLYNLPREKLTSVLKIPSPGDGTAYYEFSPSPGFRIVVLDPYDISAIGWPQDHPNTTIANMILQLKNPNSNKNSPAGLLGLERRFVMFNGAFGRKQLQWLNRILLDSTEKNQKVIICCHQPLDPSAATPEALPWNYEEVMEIIHRYGCVKACFGGHEHMGGYSVDSFGVHHCVLEAALECPPGSNAFGYVDVYQDKLVLIGTDRMKTVEMVFSL
ncbi:uncharacterized protein A4U43_C01F21570 [Asparagus officinalis]|uniref:Manganese-dependent ADP-ribose/CDP-alcohol diphosphatase n=1 Tax=Asparagus officinalis TaxID=4686 RepID=A0A5P1FSX4_ASPOF|nr:manganese-dependent ADP-ribose/CDP-alcohol diphosphatase-like [Asparagus officinalis]ONK80773.1 uncharacterized protein A4U43_C01F21570 [Asparagus officinalis]